MYDMAVLAQEDARLEMQDRNETGWRERAFDADPTAKFILDRTGKLLDRNRAADALLADHVVTVVDGQLRLGSPESNRMVLDAVKAVSSSIVGSRRVILRDRIGAWRPADLYRADGMDAVVLTFRLTSEDGRGGLDALRSNFGLSSAEARVLEALLAGDCAKEVARILSVSEHTVRSHMRTIYAKLGVRGLTGALRFALQLTC